MRLIDADALKNELSDKDYITYTHEYGDAIPVNWIMNAIDNAPTVERPQGEPVIKCKDCKYQIKEWRVNRRLKEKGYWAYGCKHFGEMMGYWGFGGNDDEFCSDAEIKEAENE